jgi:proteasome assembly chaperone (PAC2) family protein
MKHITVEELPSLRKPLLVMAFAGWNDAAQSATMAARYLVGTWSAHRFASVDPEEFFDFTSTRPMVKIGTDGTRQLDWPANDFYYHQLPSLDRDVLIFVGTEPSLRWRTFVSEVLEVAEQCGVSLVVTVGALLADAVHSRPVPLAGYASKPDLAEKLGQLRIMSTRYEGPTGIVGVIHDACRRKGLPAVSLWASVPHYLGVTGNPKAAAALLRPIDSLFGLQLDLGELEEASRAFEEQVAEVVAGSPEIAAYVRELERRIDEAVEGEAEPSLGGPELPSSDIVIRDLEEFLRLRRKQDGGP